jgi:hypothetical protein
LASALAGALIALVPITLISCSGSSSGFTPLPDNTEPTLTGPGDTTFLAPSIDVTLTAADNRDPDPSIYYTTDLSIPTDMSTLYAGPITITATTVLKAISIDAAGNESSLLTEGYTLVSNLTGIEADWASSGHGKISAEAWRHWDEDPDVQTSCARCHGDGGLKDYAADGVVDVPGAIPFGLACDACHTAPPGTIYDDLLTYSALEPVEFPSMDTASLWSNSNICTTCHQGRNSTVQVDDVITTTPGGPHTFINIHYYAAGATFFGGEVQGGYEYAGNDYAGRNAFGSHPAAQQDCKGCHMRGANNDHTFNPLLGDCTICHSGASFETLSGSPGDNYNAITALQPELLDDIQDWAETVIGMGIVYDPSAYPYWFFDTDGDRVTDPDEVNFGNRYDQFDDELLRASYNYQVVEKDPAGYIHNGTYIRQLQHDSIVALGGIPSVPAPDRLLFDTDNATKAEQWHVSGHADSTADAFRHWDDDPDIPTSCAKCHSSTGFIDHAADGTVDNPVIQGELVGCSACHNSLNLFADNSTRYTDLGTNMALDPVTFPSGATQSLGNSSNICMSCHQGRESGVSVDTQLPNGVTQAPIDYDSYDFVNRHYYAAAAIFYGSDVTAAYEYPLQNYRGQNFTTHPGGLQDCLACHARGAQDHVFEVELSDCSACHTGITDFEDLGLPFGAPNIDYDGDGNGGSFQEEIDGMQATLLTAMQAYARGGVPGLPQSSPIVYGPGSYPYWFFDTNDNSVVDPGEDIFPNRYRDFDEELLRAAFNYHAAEDPCSDIHSYKYTLQTLYDSIDELDDLLLNGSAPGIRPL